MTFSDIFKKSFIEGYTSTDFTLKTVALTLAIACIFALYLYFIYRFYTQNTFYSKSFDISLAILTVITTAVILTIQSSIVVSLGMVGALSIVRFRTAIKDPMDLVYLFWAIANGIIIGAGLPGIALALSVIITITLFILDMIPIAKAPMLLVINAANLDAANNAVAIVEKHCPTYKIKSRTVESSRADLIIELRIKDESALMSDISAVEDIKRFSLLSHDGEVTF